MALDEFEVTDKLFAADDAEVEVDEANHPNRFDSFLVAPVEVDDTIEGDSKDEPVVLLTPNDEAMPCRSFAADDVDASKSKFCDVAIFPPKSTSMFSVPRTNNFYSTR